MFKSLFGIFSSGSSHMCTDAGVKETPKIKGHFVYMCEVRCGGGVTRLIRCEVFDDVTVPKLKCSCGKTVELYPAPIVEVKEFGGIKMSRRRGQMTRLMDRDHIVKLGDTLEYRVDEQGIKEGA